MTNPLRFVAVLSFSLALALLLFSVAAAGVALAAGQARHYVCPPCSQSCDSKVFDKPGVCPQCGMTLVDADQVPAPDPNVKKVAFLVFNGVEVIDFTGPYELFGAAGFDVYTVAATKDPVTTAMGLTVVPKYTFADAPQPDILVVPGGGIKSARDSEETLKWVRETTAHAGHTMSVCNGAFILASAGLLDGLTATTTAHQIERLGTEYPKIQVVHDRRFVDNGKIITTAGLSSGMDGALHVIETVLGKGAAQQAALTEEYDWRPASGFARAALADMLIPNVDIDSTGTWTTVSTQGDTRRWEIVFHGTSKLSATELVDRLGRDFETRGKWTNAKAANAGAPTPTTSAWKFRGRDGEAWTGILSIQAAGKSHEYDGKLSIARAGS